MGAGGGLGNVAIQLAKGAFALRVIGVDMSSKKDFVMSCGAEAFVAVDGERSVADAVLELTGGLGAHAVLVLTASKAAYADSMHLLRFGGTLVCVGIPDGEPNPIKSVSAQLLVANALRVVGVSVGDRQEAIECLEFAVGHKSWIVISSADLTSRPEISSSRLLRYVKWKTSRK